MPKDNLKIQGYKSYNRGHWLNHLVIKIHSLPVLKDNPENEDVVKDKAMQANINHPYSCTASHNTSASTPSPSFSFQFDPKLSIKKKTLKLKKNTSVIYVCLYIHKLSKVIFNSILSVVQ